jgi:hypothetical protein
MNAEIWTTIGAAVAIIALGYTFLRNFKIDMQSEIKEIKIAILSIDTRLSHLEGAFQERGKNIPQIFLLKGDEIKKVEHE